MNKNISIWRGDSTPPTFKHLWLKDNDLYIYTYRGWDKIATSELTDVLNTKVDKETGKSLVKNSEIQKLSTLQIPDSALAYSTNTVQNQVVTNAIELLKTQISNLQKGAIVGNLTWATIL